MAEKDDSFELSMNNFTPRAQQVLVLAKREAKRFGHNYVGTEHLLLVLIKLGQGVAVAALQLIAGIGSSAQTLRQSGASIAAAAAISQALRKRKPRRPAAGSAASPSSAAFSGRPSPISFAPAGTTSRSRRTMSRSAIAT